MSETGKASASRGVQVEVMRSQLGRVRGLGSAKSGVATWWAERVTSIALVPLTLWFIFSLFGLIGASQEQVANWLAGPVPIVLMLCLIATTFHHMQLGLQVVIEDYIHKDATRFVLLLALRFATVLLALAAAVSVLKLGL
jgi:succinate dehydrogenase / fumarate reductase membrane anchor subunit